MSIFGVIFIIGGIAYWFVGAGRVIDNVFKRLGITRRDFPFSPVAVPLRKFNRQEWLSIFYVVLISATLFNIGIFLLNQG
jgi:hypothetical protein